MQKRQIRITQVSIAAGQSVQWPNNQVSFFWKIRVLISGLVKKKKVLEFILERTGFFFGGGVISSVNIPTPVYLYYYLIHFYESL